MDTGDTEEKADETRSGRAPGYATVAFAVLVCGSHPYLWGEYRDDDEEECGKPGYTPVLFGNNQAASEIASAFEDGTDARVVKVRISVESHNDIAERTAQRGNSIETKETKE